MLIKIKDKRWKILKYFFINPTKKTHARALARETKISHPWVLKLCRDLKRYDLLKVEKDKETGIMAIGAKREEKFLRLKRIYNLYSLYNSGLVDFLVEKYLEPKCIVLFGSYSKGEDIEKSDVDLTIITSRKLKLDLEKYEKKLARKISLMELEKDKIEKEFKSTLINGIVLYGYLDLE